MLLSCYQDRYLEAGCDEAGRGCLAGPVFAAAVILPKHFCNEELTDSKQLSPPERYRLRLVIEQEALSFAVAQVDHNEIDRINILNASFLAMHRALDQLNVRPQQILVDGNRFNKYQNIPHLCIIKGDGLYQAIAAASVLAKTYRDDYMSALDPMHPEYGWLNNKGYPTLKHREAVVKYGPSPYHRKTFRLKSLQQGALFEQENEFIIP